MKQPKPTFAYLQLYQKLKADITSGVYPIGAKLPSKRTLAEKNDVSIITAEHALQILCDEGYIESKPRSGYFVIYRESDFNTTSSFYSYHPNTAVAATIKYPFPFSVLAKTMRKVLNDYGDAILVKSPNSGCEVLKTALCNYLHRSSGMSVSPDQVIIGSGAEYLYGLIAQLLGGFAPFALEGPSYRQIRQVYEAHGVACDMLPMKNDGIDSVSLAKTRSKVLHITPYNSYPSGVTAPATKRIEYLQWCKSRNGYIVEDNYNAELTVSRKNEDTVFSMSKDDNVIYLNTFSETVAPALRVGYMVLPKTLVDLYESKLGFYSCTVPTFEQYVLAELLTSGDFERHINRVRRQKRKDAKLTIKNI